MTPAGLLTGRNALVSGGSRGIGLAAARGLGRAGARVSVTARDRERLERAVAELRAEGLDVVGRAADVSRPAEVAALREALGSERAPDVLVNCAGVTCATGSKMVLRTSPDEWRRVLSVNLDGTFQMIAAFVPGMKARRFGRVVNVSACLGRMTGPGCRAGLASYRVSKASVNALTRVLSAELGDGRQGVLVDAMCPGHCRTEMGGTRAPRSAEQGADTIVWLAQRPDGSPTGRLWEDRREVAW